MLFCSLDLEPNKLSASTYDIYVADVDAKQQNDAVRWFMQITSLMVPFKRLLSLGTLRQIQIITKSSSSSC